MFLATFARLWMKDHHPGLWEWLLLLPFAVGGLLLASVTRSIIKNFPSKRGTEK
jgi:hypothetical protein